MTAQKADQADVGKSARRDRETIYADLAKLLANRLFAHLAYS